MQKSLVTKSGTKVSLLSNSFPLQFNTQLFRYRVILEPEIDNNHPSLFYKVLSTVKKELDKNLKPYAPMNFVLYSPILLDTEELILTTNYENVEYKITIRDPHIFNPSEESQANLAFIGRFMKNLLRYSGLRNVGRKYFDDKRSTEITGFRLAVWPGFKTSLNYKKDGVALNVDLSFKIVRHQTVYDYAEEILKMAGGNFGKVKEMLNGMTVVTAYNNHIYTILEVTIQQTPQDKFELNNGKTVSYAKYYEERYNRKLKYPNSFLIVTKGRKKDEEIHLIPELCVITGQSEKMKQDFNLQKELNKVVKPSAFHRFESNRKLIKILYENEKTKEILKDWQISISEQAKKVEGWKLEAGNFVLGNNKQIAVNDKRLDREVQGEMLNQPELKKIAVFCSEKEKQNAEIFKQELNLWRQESNFPIKEPPKIFVIEGHGFGPWEKKFAEILDPSVQLVVLVLSGSKKQGKYYNECKKLLVNKYPIPCQVILGSTFARQNFKSILRNSFRQICCKVGGSPWTITELPFTEQPVMIVGIDVFHGGKPGKSKSLLGFCATMDRHFSRYWPTIDQHGPGEEIGKGLQRCVKGAMLAFYETNKGRFPEKVIVYRDGVGESQGKTLREMEVKAFLRAFDELTLLLHDSMSLGHFQKRGKNFIKKIIPFFCEGFFFLVLHFSPQCFKFYPKVCLIFLSQRSRWPLNLTVQLTSKVILTAFASQRSDLLFSKIMEICCPFRIRGDRKSVQNIGQPAGKRLKESSKLTKAPDFIFIHVNKSPVAKFFAEGTRQGEIGNVESGTVVDGITRGFREFYLISQRMMGAGTANPTQYSVMSCWRNIKEEYVEKTWDVEDGMFEDLKVLTNKLCYLYYNFVGPIKVAAPVHYAHVLAKFIGEKWNEDSSFKPHAAWEKMKSLYFI